MRWNDDKISLLGSASQWKLTWRKICRWEHCQGGNLFFKFIVPIYCMIVPVLCMIKPCFASVRSILQCPLSPRFLVWWGHTLSLSGPFFSVLSLHVSLFDGATLWVCQVHSSVSPLSTFPCLMGPHFESVRSILQCPLSPRFLVWWGHTLSLSGPFFSVPSLHVSLFDGATLWVSQVHSSVSCLHVSLFDGATLSQSGPFFSVLSSRFLVWWGHTLSLSGPFFSVLSLHVSLFDGPHFESVRSILQCPLFTFPCLMGPHFESVRSILQCPLFTFPCLMGPYFKSVRAILQCPLFTFPCLMGPHFKSVRAILQPLSLHVSLFDGATLWVCQVHSSVSSLFTFPCLMGPHFESARPILQCPLFTFPCLMGPHFESVRSIFSVLSSRFLVWWGHTLSLPGPFFSVLSLHVSLFDGATLWVCQAHSSVSSLFTFPCLMGPHFESDRSILQCPLSSRFLVWWGHTLRSDRSILQCPLSSRFLVWWGHTLRSDRSILQCPLSSRFLVWWGHTLSLLGPFFSVPSLHVSLFDGATLWVSPVQSSVSCLFTFPCLMGPHFESVRSILQCPFSQVFHVSSRCWCRLVRLLKLVLRQAGHCDVVHVTAFLCVACL